MRKLLAIYMLTLFLTGIISAQGYEIGDVATDFKLKNVDGQMVSLSDYKDAKGHIVIFTCNHCPFAVMYEDRIIDIHNKYAEQGFSVVAINPNDPIVVPDDSYESMIVRAKEKDFPFAYVIDEGQKIFPQYGATKTPHVFLLDKDLVVRYIGAIDDNHQNAYAVQTRYLENAIDAVAKGETPEVEKTKAIGCSVKIKK